MFFLTRASTRTQHVLGLVTAEKPFFFFLLRLNSVFEVAEDTEIDIPQLWKYLGELMGPSAFDGNLGLDVLFECVFKHVQKHKAARLFACMLQSCEKVNWSVGVLF